MQLCFFIPMMKCYETVNKVAEYICEMSHLKSSFSKSWAGFFKVSSFIFLVLAYLLDIVLAMSRVVTSLDPKDYKN